MSLDNARFLNLVKMKATLPSGRYTDQEILDIAYDVLLSDIQPWIIKMREEYFIKKSNTSVTSGTASYPINSRALGLSLRELKFIDSGGNIHNLSRISPEDINDSTQGTPNSFYFEGTNIVLYPTPSVTGTLVQSYFQRISKPVEVTECAQVTNIDTVTGVITATPPNSWTTSNTFDFISRNSYNDTLAINLTASAITSTTITFTNTDIPTSLAIGDYIALAGESPYVSVPDDIVPLLQQLVVVDLLEALGDANAVQLAMAKAEKLRAGLVGVLSTRIEGESLHFRPQI